MFPFPFQQEASPMVSEPSSEATSPTPCKFPWQTVNEANEDEQRRLDAMERDEPKRRRIRDAKALAKLRGITQVRMAEEIGVPHRTLEDWLQFRRMPKAPGSTLLRRWVAAYSKED